jgi:putative heme-binding domain-containing protein
LHKPDILGAVYRVRRSGAAKVDDPRGLKLDWGKMSAVELAGLLGDGRPAVRKRAMAVLAKVDRGETAVAVANVIKGTGSSLAKLNAVWTATRIDHADARAAVRAALASFDETGRQAAIHAPWLLRDRDAVNGVLEKAVRAEVESSSELVRQAAIHSVGLWRDKEAVNELIGLLSSPSRQQRRAAAEALGRVGDGRAVPALLAALRESGDRVLEHSLIYALVEIGRADLVEAEVAKAKDPVVERAGMIVLDQMEGGGLKSQRVAEYLTSRDSGLRETAAWIAGRHPEWGDALASAFAARMSEKLADGDRADLERQLGRLAKSPAIQTLLARGIREPDAAQRRFAMGAMAQAALKEVPATWLDALSELLTQPDADVTAGAVSTLRRLNPKKDAAAKLIPKLYVVAARGDLPTPTRLDALAAVPGGIGTPSPDVFAFLTAQLGADQVAHRVAAAEIISRSKLSSEQLLALAKALGNAGPLEIAKLLTPFENASGDDLGFALVDALANSKGLAALREDVIASKLKKFGPEIREKAKGLYARLNPDAAAQKATLEEVLSLVSGGDVRRGQAVFNSTKAACASCHAIGYLGGNVGPDLTRIGSIRQERDLLESILFPSASFVQSYEPVIIETGDDVYAGVVRGGDANQVVLAKGAGPEQEVRIPRANIKSQRPGQLSVMPAGLDQQLTKQELADLVAFLRACR